MPTEGAAGDSACIISVNYEKYKSFVREGKQNDANHTDRLVLAAGLRWIRRRHP